MSENLMNNALLKKLGFDANNKWCFFDESVEKFLTWFSENISDSNILTELEQNDYENLKKHNQVLTEEEIKEKLVELEESYPHLLEYSDQDVEILEKKLEELKEIEELHENLLENLKESELKQIKDLNKLQKDLVDVELHQKIATDECLEKTKKLCQQQQINQQKIASLNQCYIQNHTPPLLMHQMPLDQYSAKCDQFLKYLEVYMKKNFNIADTFDTTNRDPLTEIVADLEEAKERIVTAENKLLEVKINVESSEYLLEKTKNHQWKPMSYYDLKRLTEEIEAENEGKKLQLEVLKQELSLLVNDKVDQEVQLMLVDFNQKKKERATERLDKINMISDITSSFEMNVEMIWILMQLDMDKLKNKVDNSKDLFNEAQICNKRIRLMRSLEVSDSLEIILQSRLSQIIGNHLGLQKDQIKSIKDCLDEFLQFEQNIEAFLETLAGRKFFRDFDLFLKRSKTNAKILNEFVYNGPTNKPQLLDPKYLDVIQEKTMKTEAIGGELNKLKKDYVTNCIEPMNNNKYLRYKENLWVFFLTEPKKVLQAIKDVTVAASQVPSYKAVVGLKNKFAM